MNSPWRWPILAVSLASLWAAGMAVAQVPFEMVVVDPNNAGDDKAAADIDGDGDDDGILGGNSLAWYRSEGAARSFTQFLIRPNPIYTEFTTDMEVGDIDGDGDIDLILADGPGVDNVLWFENPRLEPAAGVDPDPTVGSNWLHHPIGSHGTWMHDVTVGDIDGDQRLDVVSGGHGELHIWFQNAGQTWTDKDLGSLAGEAPAIADVDGDGDRDLFSGSAWLEAPADSRSGVWTAWPIAGANPGDGPAILVHDWNGDDRPDLVTVRQHSRGLMAWYQNPADPRFGDWTEHPIDDSQGSHHLRMADFDRDGWPDLLTGLEQTEIAVYYRRGTAEMPTFERQVLLGTAGHNAVSGDLDGDSRPDVWACDYIGNPPVRVLWNNGNGIFADGFESGDVSTWSTAVPRAPEVRGLRQTTVTSRQTRSRR